MPMNSALRQQWVKAGYTSHMGSAEVDAPPDDEFRRVYHFTSAEYAISNIALGRIKVARFADLNDPFELLPLNLPDKAGRKAMQAFKKDFDEQKGLLCFSRNWINPVLWAQYADKHRGIALGFNLSKKDALPVTYETDRLPEKSFDPTALGNKIVQTKFALWSYEDELRSLVELCTAHKEGPLYFKPFSKDLILAEVILGVRCKLTLERMRELVNSMHPSVKTYSARLAIKTFSVVPEEETVP